MVVELGLFSLIVALLLAVAQAWFGLAGPALGNRRWMAAARPAVTGQWVFVAMSFAVLCWAFYRNDFTVQYVANNSNSALPTFYRFAAVWGAHIRVNKGFYPATHKPMEISHFFMSS